MGPRLTKFVKHASAHTTARPCKTVTLRISLPARFASSNGRNGVTAAQGQGNEMAAVLTRAGGRSKRSVSGFHFRSVLAGHGPFSSEAASTAVGDPVVAATGEHDGDDLRSRIFRLGLAKRSATAALEKWSSEGRDAPAAELRRIARDLTRVRRYKHALEVRHRQNPCPLLLLLLLP